jgi:hypothetical protein
MGSMSNPDWADVKAREFIAIVLKCGRSNTDIARECIAMELRIIRELGASEGIDRVGEVLGVRIITGDTEEITP